MAGEVKEKPRVLAITRSEEGTFVVPILPSTAQLLDIPIEDMDTEFMAQLHMVTLAASQIIMAWANGKEDWVNRAKVIAEEIAAMINFTTGALAGEALKKEEEDAAQEEG